MRVFLMLLAMLACSVMAGLAIGRFTVNGAALAAAPGPTMPRYAGALDEADQPATAASPSASPDTPAG